MLKLRSIRSRLTLWYALALAAALLLFAGAIAVSSWNSLLHDVDESVLARVRSVNAFLNAELKEPGVQLPEELGEYADAFPGDSLLEVRDEHGTPVFASSPAFPWPAKSSAAPVTQTWQNRDYRVFTTTVTAAARPWLVRIAEPLASIERLQTRLVILLAALLPLVIGMASVGGYWLSRRALKPVDQITAAARTIGIENLSQRLAVPKSADELQRLSLTLNSMLARLEDAVKRLTTFTADASHELRTPLAVIRSTAEIACRKPRSAESYRESLAQIVTESERVTHLVEDLLFLARCDAQTLDIPLARLEPCSVVADVCKLLTPLADAKNIDLNFQPPAKPLHIAANESAFHRLALILIDNAIKYSTESGQVTVALSPNGDTIRLSVQDSGPGISDAERPRIFDRFYRSPSLMQNGHGSGLGLALAAGIAERHQARITVASQPGKGATFTVTFPASRG